MNEKLPKLKLSVRKIAVITAAVVGVMIIAAVLLFSRLDLFGDDPEYTEDTPDTSIPEMQSQDLAGGHDIYYEKNTDAPLADVKEYDSYVMTLRMISYYGENRSTESVTVTKQGEKYKTVSDSHTTIYDGETLYISYAGEILRIPTTESKYHDEIGVTSLDTLRAMSEDTEHYETTFEISSDGRIIEAVVNDLTTDGVRMEFEISVESGLVTSERSYYNDTAYRIVLTESLDMTGAGISEDTFRIPD